MNSLARLLIADVPAQFSQTISKIEKIEGAWALFSKEQGRLKDSFDLVVLAIPSKQAADLIPNRLTNLQKICANSRMLPCWTLIVYQESKISLPFDGAFVDESPFSWIARNNSKPSRSTYESWTAQANPEWSNEYVRSNNYEVEPLLVSAFEKITGQPCKLYQSHLWRYARVEHPRDESYILDKDNQIGICGDWLLHSTVEGAWTSGNRLAEKINMIPDQDLVEKNASEAGFCKSS
jgi:predicted NAD/FAD-dependent oxidoreductase